VKKRDKRYTLAAIFKSHMKKLFLQFYWWDLNSCTSQKIENEIQSFSRCFPFGPEAESANRMRVSLKYIGDI